jgi:hypothetical protein
MSATTPLGRRTFLKAVGFTIPALALAPLSGVAKHRSRNPIIEENEKRGTSDWLLTNAAENREIEAYASWTSIDRGSPIQIFANTAEPSYKLEVFRVGWYGGAGGRRVFGPVTLGGTQQVTPKPDPVTGLIECDWKDPFTLYTDRSWTRGVYLAKLTAGQSNKQSYVSFVLRDDGGRSQLLFQTSVTTYQAYNNWGGKSLYGFNSTGVPAVKVSFNRPYTAGNGAGELFAWEINLLRFLEREGYDVAYCSSITTHNDSSMLRKRKAFLSVGHDEYWSAEMRKNIIDARNDGVHLGFFGANCCYWQIRLERSAVTGAPRRTIVCYKERFQEDPLFGIDNSRVTALWRSDVVNRPEEQFIGIQYDFFPVDTDIIVDNASHFIFEGTGLSNGDRLPGLLGYEADRIFGGGPANLIRLCRSPVINGGDAIAEPQSSRVAAGLADMTIYTARSGALVFAAGTMQFNWGLDDGANSSRTRLVNPAAQQMARNLLGRFVEGED